MLHKLPILIRINYNRLKSSVLMKCLRKRLRKRERVLVHLLELKKEPLQDYFQELQEVRREFQRQRLLELERQREQLELRRWRSLLDWLQIMGLEWFLFLGIQVLMVIKLLKPQKLDNGKQQKSSVVYALKLPVISRLLKESQKADLIELRTSWYENHTLNLWTHFSVWLKTQKYLIVDLFYFSMLQKIKDLFQPMNKPRIYR